MKESEEDLLKCVVYESTLSTAGAVPLPNGEGCDTRIPLFSTQRLSKGGRQRGGGFAAKKEANPASLRSAAPSKGRGSRGHSFIPMEGGAPKGRRLDGDGGVKKSGGIVSSASFTRAHYPPLARFPFPNGEGYETRAPLSPKHSLSLMGKAKRCDALRP